MHGIDHWPVKIKNMDGLEFLVCTRDCSWRPWDRFPLQDHRILSTFLYTLPPWELYKVQDLVLSIDQAKVSVHWDRQYVKQPSMDRMKEALDAREILVYSTADPDEAALKALREKIQLVLTEILTQERAEAVRLEAEHSSRTLLEKAGAHAVAGAKGLGQAGLTFLTWVKDVYEVVSIHERQRRMMQAAWETYNSDTDDWVGTFKNRMIAAEHKEVVEALGFDPLKVDREMLSEAYEIANLVWEDEKTQAMLVKFAEDYARAQHSLEWTNIAGGAAFEIILTVVLTVFTGGVGTAAMFGGKVRLLTPMKKLGGLFEELAKLRRRVKLRKNKGKGSAGGKPSSLEDYVTDEPVPRPEPPPKGDRREEQGRRDENQSSDSDLSSNQKLREQSDKYAELVNLNKPWSWKDFPEGESLTIKQKREIKQAAIDRGLIPDIPYKPGTKYPDFEAVGLIEKVDHLPEELWKSSDYHQFKWLDSRIPGGRPEGFTWHHSEVPGRMELVPFGPHNSINHNGGRSKGLWADAKR